MACIRIPNGSPTGPPTGLFGPPTGCSRSEEMPLLLPYLFVHLARPGLRFDFPVERPRAGLVSPPVRLLERLWAPPSAGARRNQWPWSLAPLGSVDC